jgi:hypothetical protein
MGYVQNNISLLCDYSVKTYIKITFKMYIQKVPTE